MAFLIYALPRSRTAWLAQFLSYRDWVCKHEQAIYMRTLNEVYEFFHRGNTGAVETAAVQGRPLIRYLVPDIKEVVVLRPVHEVVDSMLKTDISGVAVYDRNILQRNMEYGDRELRKIAKEKGVLTVYFADLVKEDTCAAIFEHCLPYTFDKAWWESLKERNIQVNVKEVLRYYFDNRDAVEGFKHHCRRELSRLCRSGEIRKVRM